MQACCSAPPHDNVCRLLGWGSPDTADGSLTGGLKDDAVIYMVLEDAGEEVDTTYSPEESLRCFKQIVSGPPPRPIFAHFSAFSHADACVHAGVRHAHGRGFYHRNLKVENVARMKSGAVKLIRLGHSQGVAPGRTHARAYPRDDTTSGADVRLRHIRLSQKVSTPAPEVVLSKPLDGTPDGRFWLEDSEKVRRPAHRPTASTC